MNPDRINAVAQVLTLVAVILGLGLVIYELRQSAKVADATMFTSTIDTVNNRLLVRMGENPGDALFKVAVCPEMLTGRDLVTLDAFYKLFMVSLSRERRVTNTLSLERPNDASTRAIVQQYFDNDAARRWLKLYLSIGDKTPLTNVPGLIDTIRQAGAESDIAYQKRSYAALAGRELNCEDMLQHAE